MDLDRPSGELIHEEPEIVHRLMAPPPTASQATGRIWGPNAGMVDQTWLYIRREEWPLCSYTKDSRTDMQMRRLDFRGREVTARGSIAWLYNLHYDDFVAHPGYPWDTWAHLQRVFSRG